MGHLKILQCIPGMHGYLSLRLRRGKTQVSLRCIAGLISCTLKKKQTLEVSSVCIKFCGQLLLLTWEHFKLLLCTRKWPIQTMRRFTLNFNKISLCIFYPPPFPAILCSLPSGCWHFLSKSLNSPPLFSSYRAVLGFLPMVSINIFCTCANLGVPLACLILPLVAPSWTLEEHMWLLPESLPILEAWWGVSET